MQPVLTRPVLLLSLIALTRFGRYKFTTLPFGLSASPEVFQKFMNDILSDLAGCEVYMDDILLHPKTRSTPRKTCSGFSDASPIMASNSTKKNVVSIKKRLSFLATPGPVKVSKSLKRLFRTCCKQNFLLIVQHYVPFLG